MSYSSSIVNQKSMNGIISITDGYVNISNGDISNCNNLSTNNLTTDNHTSSNLITNNIEEIDNSTQINLYDSPANSHGIYFGNTNTNLYIVSPVIFQGSHTFNNGELIAQSIQQTNSTSQISLYTNSNPFGLVMGNSSLDITNNSLNTFSISPIIPLATTSTQASNLQNITNAITNLKNGINTWSNLNTFSVIPQCASTPTLNNQLTNKSYADGLITTLKSGNNTFTGLNTFSQIPLCSINATSSTQLVNFGTLLSELGAGVSNIFVINNSWSGTNTYSNTVNTTLINNSTDINTSNNYVSNVMAALSGTINNTFSCGSLSAGNNSVFGSDVSIGKNLYTFLDNFFKNLPICNQIPTLWNQLINKQYCDTTIQSYNIGSVIDTSNFNNAYVSDTSNFLCGWVIEPGIWLCEWSINIYNDNAISSTISSLYAGISYNTEIVFLTPSTIIYNTNNTIIGYSNLLRSGSCVIDTATFGLNVYLNCNLSYTYGTLTTGSYGTGFRLIKLKNNI